MKKAQIKMTETIGVLVVFFVLVLMGFIFYAQYQKGAIRQEQTERHAKTSVATSLKVFYMSELRCSNENIAIPACIDLQKFNILEQQIRETDESYNFYSIIFGKADIYINNLIDNEIIILYNGTPSRPAAMTPIRFPISIYDATATGTCGAVSGTCKFGVLNIDVYE
jgi:hypothetical protein